MAQKTWNHEGYAFWKSEYLFSFLNLTPLSPKTSKFGPNTKFQAKMLKHEIPSILGTTKSMDLKI